MNPRRRRKRREFIADGSASFQLANHRPQARSLRYQIMDQQTAAIGIIGGSGLYQIEGFSNPEEHRVETPFGPPSDVIMGGEVAGRQVYFLPRHGRGHRLLPHELNHRANIYALRSLGVRWIICVTAVGSLQEKYAPRDVVLPSQFYDRTSQRAAHTFFGDGIAAHVTFAVPICTPLRDLLAEAAASLGVRVHNGGTYVNMDGPAFSTRAESELNRRHGFDVIGMTNLPEAKLAREAEIALATMAMITDYDCWKTDEEPVSAQTVIGHLLANAETAKKVLTAVIPRLPTKADWPEHRALDSAIITDKALWPPATREKLKAILARFA
jgi:5'-methylthioadenosine phosphorylase